MEVDVDEHLESPYKGLYIIGDGSGRYTFTFSCQRRRCIRRKGNLSKLKIESLNVKFRSGI